MYCCIFCKFWILLNIQKTFVRFCWFVCGLFCFLLIFLYQRKLLGVDSFCFFDENEVRKSQNLPILACSQMDFMILLVAPLLFWM